MEKKGQVLLITFIAVILLLIVGGLVTYFFMRGNNQAIIQSTCSITSSGQKPNIYPCPTGKTCEASVTLNCNTKTSDPRVIFRTNAVTNGDLKSYGISDTSSSYPPKWIAVAISSQASLQGFKLYNHHSGSSSITCTEKGTPILKSDGTQLKTPEGFRIYLYNERIRLYKTCQYSKSYDYSEFTFSTEGDLTPSSISYYKSNNQEVVDGNLNNYQCSQKITDQNGNTLKNVIYSGNVSGSKTEKVSLSAGQTANWLGTINYVETEIRNSECTVGRYYVDTSNQNRYYSCVADSNGCGKKSTSPIYCSPSSYVFNEDTQKCTPPYNVDFTISKTLFSTSEDIIGSLQLKDTTNLAYIPIKVSLLNNIGQEVNFISLTTDSYGKRDFNLGKVNIVGDYKIAIKISHPLGIIDISKSISVSNPIFLRLAPEPDNIQYTGDTIKAKAFVTGIDGEPTTAYNWIFTGTKCNNIDLSDKINIDPIKVGEYILSTKVDSPCNFIYQAFITDGSGLKSSPATINIQVKQASILIKSDVTNLQDKDEGTYVVTFNTLDNNLQPIETDNSVIVTDANACKSSQYCSFTNSNIPNVIVNTISPGKYSFSFNYKAGLNTIDISSISKENNQVRESIQLTVNMFRGGSGGDITGGSSMPLIIGAIVIALGIGIFIFIIFRKNGKK